MLYVRILIMTELSKQKPQLLKLASEGSPILRKTCCILTKKEIFSDVIQKLIDNMIYTSDIRKNWCWIKCKSGG